MSVFFRAVSANRALVVVLVMTASIIWVAPQRPGEATASLTQSMPAATLAQADSDTVYPEPPFIIGEDSGVVPATMRAIVLGEGRIDLRRGGQLIQRIAIPEGPLELHDMVTRIASPRWTREVSPGVFEMRAALIQAGASELRITAPTVSELRLSNDPGVFMGATVGTAVIQGVTITSWNLEDETPVIEADAPRAFLRYEGSSRLQASNSEFAFLGTDPVGPGVSVRGSQASAQITSSVFHDNIVGLVFSSRSRGEVVNSLLRDNLSDGLLIEAGAGAQVTRTFAEGNRGVGLRLSSAGSSTVIDESEVRGNALGGAAIVASSRGAIRTTLFEENGSVGIDVDSAASVEVRANRVRGHTTGIRIGLGGGGGASAIQNNIIERSSTGVEVALDATDVSLTGTRISGPGDVGMLLGGEVSTLNSTITGVTTAFEVNGRAEIEQSEVSGVVTGIRLAEGARATVRDLTMTADEAAVDVGRDSSVTITGDSSVTAPVPAVGDGSARFDGVAGVGNITYGDNEGAPASVILLVIGLGALALAGAVVLVRALPKRVSPDDDEVDVGQRPAQSVKPPEIAMGTADLADASAIAPPPAIEEPVDDGAEQPADETDREPDPHDRFMAEIRPTGSSALRNLDEDTAWLAGNAAAATLGLPEMMIGSANHEVPIELVAAFTGGATVAGAKVTSVGAAGREATLHSAGIRHRAAALLTLENDGSISGSVYRPGLSPSRAKAEGLDFADRLASKEVMRNEGGRVTQQDDVSSEFLSYLTANFDFEPLTDRVVVAATVSSNDLLDLLAERGLIEIHETDFEATAESLGALAERICSNQPVDVLIARAGQHWAVGGSDGKLLPTPIISALVVRSLLATGPATVVADLTVSNTVIDEAHAAGGTVVQSNPTLAALRESFDDARALVAVGRPGMHFLPGSTAEDLGLISGLIVGSSDDGAELHHAPQTVSNYWGSEDVPVDVADIDGALDAISRRYSDDDVTRLAGENPGIRVDGDGWWVSARVHPDGKRVLLRAEASTEADRDQRVADLTAEVEASQTRPTPTPEADPAPTDA